MTSASLPNAYTITTDQRRFDTAAIHAFLSRAYWSPGVPLAVVCKALENSLAFGILFGDVQVGLGRVVTDKATFAYLADVYVLEAHRGKGLSKCLLEAIHAHDDLQCLRRFLLATKDAHSLYARFGFQSLANPSRMMEILNPGVYQGS